MIVRIGCGKVVYNESNSSLCLSVCDSVTSLSRLSNLSLVFMKMAVSKQAYDSRPMAAELDAPPSYEQVQRDAPTSSISMIPSPSSPNLQSQSSQSTFKPIVIPRRSTVVLVAFKLSLTLSRNIEVLSRGFLFTLQPRVQPCLRSPRHLDA